MENKYLVQYRGGGFDGCYWEWNYCLIDNKDPQKAENFENINATGRFGCENLQQLKENLLNEHENDHFYVFDLTDIDSSKEFEHGSNPQHVAGVMQFLLKNEKEEFALEFTCDDCGEDLTESLECGDFSFLTNGHGDGGIGITYDKKMCYSCRMGESWQDWWKGEVLEELEKREIKLPEMEDSDLDRFFFDVMDGAGIDLEAHDDDFSLDVEELVDHIEENLPVLIQKYICQDKQENLC